MTVPRKPHRKQVFRPTPLSACALDWSANDPEAGAPAYAPGTGHCPTCTCHQFDPRTSRVLDLVVDLHEALELATAQVGTMRAILEEEVLP